MKTHVTTGLLIIILILSGCATAPKVVYPNVTNFVNSTDFKKYKKLAVLPFTDAPHSPYSGQIVQGLASQAFGKFGFDIVERGRLSEVLGVKALVLGEVGQYETSDRKTDTTYFPWTWDGRTTYIPVQGQQWKESYVSISLRVVDVETGQLVYFESYQRRSEHCDFSSDVSVKLKTNLSGKGAGGRGRSR